MEGLGFRGGEFGVWGLFGHRVPGFGFKVYGCPSGSLGFRF